MITYPLRLRPPHFQPENYLQAVDWVDALCEPSSARWCGGITYLNGTLYYSEIEFSHNEDRLVFILTFPELV